MKAMLTRFLPRLCAFFVPVSLSLALSLSLPANDTSYGSQNGTFRFLKSPQVSLKKEVLTVARGQITVEYVFKNESDVSLRIPTVFPMPPMLFPAFFGDVSRIRRFEVFVDGRKLEPERHFVALFRGHDITSELRSQGWDEARLVELFRGCWENEEDARKERLERIPGDWVSKGWMSSDAEPRFSLQEDFAWELEMKPQQQRSVRHTYAPSGMSTVPLSAESLLGWKCSVDSWPGQTEDAPTTLDTVLRKADPALLKALENPAMRERFFDPTYLEYKLSTGANWKGPIQDFTLIIKKHSADTVFTNYGDPQLQAMEISRPDPKTIVYHATGFVPRGELRFLFAEPMPADWGRTPREARDE